VTVPRALKQKVALLWPHLDERARRLFAASEARQLGHGGVSLVSRACGLSRVTITKGLEELAEPPLPPGRVRRPGGGRPALVARDPDLPSRLEALVEPLTRGDPESPLRWTSKSTRALAAELAAQHHRISHEKVAQLLRQMDYSLQGNRKTEEGDDHPDRDTQFLYINDQVRRALAAKRPVISVDTKKKELLGNYQNAGRQWRPTKTPDRVQVHDFPAPSVPRAYPYGIYDLGRNTGFVNVGTDHDTGAFAVASIRGWWRAEGQRLYPTARRLLITADGGGSNGYRLRQWKLELQRFADATGLAVLVCHFPPGTSKWNKVEHRLFSFISSNWRGEPLRDYETIVRLIANTTTAKGLTVRCRLDRHRYPAGRKVSDEEMATVNLTPQSFHGEWNYLIRPHGPL
jgi:Rhodopirellula transposase DDE domain